MQMSSLSGPRLHIFAVLIQVVPVDRAALCFATPATCKQTLLSACPETSVLPITTLTRAVRIRCVCRGLQGSEHHVRYLSMHENNYLRYFRGHSLPVTSLSVSPRSDQFLSAAMARTCLLLLKCCVECLLCISDTLPQACSGAF